MVWKQRTLEQWMRIGFVALFIIGLICSLIIAVGYLK